MKSIVFGDNLTFLKKLAGLTQATFSKKYGCTSRTVARWEEGLVPWGHTLRKISYFFSRQLNIPIELFDDGKALLNKDFEFLLENNRELIALASKRSNEDVDHELDLPIIEHVNEMANYDVKVGVGPGKTSIKHRIYKIQECCPDIHPSVKFAVRTRDNRMEQAGIHKGDLLFVTPIKVSQLKE